MQPKHLQLLINLGGALLGVLIIAYIANAAWHKDAAEPCSARYPGASRFSLQTSEGKPLTAIELQARAGLREMGVIDNASVVAAPGGPAPEALEVKLRPLPAGADPEATARNGIAFDWAPSGLESATAACLSYSVWLPDKFVFGRGGKLPGIFGRQGAQVPQQGKAFSVSPQWGANGTPLVGATLEGGDIRRMSGNTVPLPTNRWVKIEQEVTLNEPRKANGSVRLWIDGALAVEDTQVPLRTDAKTVLAGVLAAVGYSQRPEQPGVLRLSPFEIGWR